MENLRRKTDGMVKFIICSLVGLFVFFVPIGGRIPIDYITSFLYNLFGLPGPGANPDAPPLYIYLVLVMCIYAFVDMYLTKSYKRSGVDIVLSICKALGTIITILVLLRVDVPYLMAPNIAPATLVSMGRSTIMIFCTAAFLPFLLDYGLIDSVGVLAKPFMRPVFKVPGITAVVAASTFLGNFSIGLISTSRLYRAGRLTKKESAIVATGFSTISIGLMLMFAQLLRISDRFLFYFISTAIVTYIITAITVRIPPISWIKEEYCEDVPPVIEEEVKEGKLSQAVLVGAETAAKAPSIPRTVGSISLVTAKVLAGMISSSMFIIVIGLLINDHTPVFQWLGMLFYPVLRIFNMPDIDILQRATGLAAIDVIPAVMFGSLHDMSLAARYVLAAFPVSLIIFIGGYFTCLISTDIPIKIRYLPVLWVIRMLLALIFYCAIALVFFG